jgi:hypothetical protein
LNASRIVCIISSAVSCHHNTAVLTLTRLFAFRFSYKGNGLLWTYTARTLRLKTHLTLTEQNPWEADRRSASQEILRLFFFFLNPMFIARARHRSLYWASLIQSASPHLSLKTHFSIIIPYTPKRKWNYRFMPTELLEVSSQWVRVRQAVSVNHLSPVATLRTHVALQFAHTACLCVSYDYQDKRVSPPQIAFSNCLSSWRRIVFFEVGAECLHAILMYSYEEDINCVVSTTVSWLFFP